ncbi:glycosyltransferase family 4 protein [Pseudonocardia ailaonensis]|uniref:glycosyltransferase family 4 protein n=1 Tax=Pseudonocardia ailaonensis TaxID=367279 RepID=UPI0031D925AB
MSNTTTATTGRFTMVREARRFLTHLRAQRTITPTTGTLRPAVSAHEDGLNVLIVTSEAPPIVSGISRCVDRLTTGLRGRGHRVDVLSSVQIPRLSFGEYRFSAMLAYWRHISAMTRDYDVINLHGPVPTMSDVFLLLAGARRGTPVVYTHHSALAVRGAETLSGVYNRLHRILSGRADMTLTTSQFYADSESRGSGRPPVKVIEWGTDLRPLAEKKTDGPLQVLFVGQMRPYKGLEWLIPAVAGQDGMELTLIGDGPHRADYQRLAAGATNITFRGRVSDEELAAAYDSADVVTLPSVTQAEAFGLVVLEGMMAGAVPVVSDLPGVRDLAAGPGTIVPARDVDTLRAALRELADDRALLATRSAQARAKAETLTWDSCIARYEDALFTAIEARGTVAPVTAPAMALAA